MAADHVEPAAPVAQYRSPFVPIVIFVATFLVSAVFQTSQLINERDALRTMHANQERQIEESKKLRERLDTLSRQTQLLANRGNRNALLIVDQLRKRGITINTEPSAQPAPALPGAPAPAPTAPPAPAK